MLSLHYIRENPAVVARAIADKNVALDLDTLLALDGEVRTLKTRADTLRAERNAISDGFKSAAPEERPALGAKAKAIGAEIAEIEGALGEKQAALDALLLRVPNIPWEGAPVGPDESFNIVVRQEGTIPAFDFEPLDHVALIEKNDWADLARITQVAGSRTYCLKGRLAMLEQALMLWAQQRLAADGFTLMTVPALARPQAFVATGHFPGHEEEAYHMPADAEGMLKALEIPYQGIEASTGDMGNGKFRMNDIESWVPSLGKYRETHSCSTLHDWQARRANLRWRDEERKVRFCHTLNNTALASPRILVPLLENHQKADG